MMLNKRSTAEAVYELLKRRIENRELKSGEALPSERELQRELGISRISLREGLARLSALGIIDVAHGKGAVVATSARPEALEATLMPLRDEDDPGLIDEIYEARAMIESEIASLAAKRCDAEWLAELRRNIEESEAVVDDGEAFAGKDLEFHALLAEAAGNRYMSIMKSAIEGSTDKLVRIHGADKAKRQAILDRHRALLKAVESKDADKARALARAHLAESRGD